MANPCNTPPPSIGSRAKKASMPSSTTQNRSVSHGTAAVLVDQVNLSPDGDDKSISIQRIRKRDKFRNWFRSLFCNLFQSAEPEVKVRTQAVGPETTIHHARASSIEARDDIGHAGSSIKVSSPEAGAQLTTDMTKARLNIFSKNVGRPVIRIALPERGARIDTISQLVLCSSLLLKKPTLSPCSEGASDQTKESPQDMSPQDMSTDSVHRDWVKDIEQHPIEQDHIRWLKTRMVRIFAEDTLKDEAAIAEVILLGPVLDREHYRILLDCFINKFKQSIILDEALLHGLVQLVQCACEGFLDADDLVKILSILRTRLQDTHQQSTKHPYHLTLAVSRLLDVMADGKVKDVKRVEEREPLSAVLSGLKASSDPFLMYQASYAFQAMQYVPDDENALEAVLRHSTGVAVSLVKISGVFKLDLGSFLDGLGGLQEALGNTFGTAKSGYEGVRSLIESGRGVIDSLKEGLGSGDKRLWYPALRAADNFVRQGQLANLNQLIVEAPCRRDPLFQWGICQLLGEIAADATWEIITRKEAINALGDLYRNDTDWARDESVKARMLTIVEQLGKTSDFATSAHANTLLNDLKKDGGSTTSHSYPLRTRLPIPMSSPLLAWVQNIPYVEYDLHKINVQRLGEGCKSGQPVYIPPMSKPNLQDRTNNLFPLIEKVHEFLASDRQVMLILGDSGAGKSTFNHHLERELLRDYKCGGQIPLFIDLPKLEKPDKELIAEQLKVHNFSEGQIQELKLHRQFIVICDGYDESRLTTNLHTTNRLNQPGQWNTKLVVSCRSQYLGQDYRDRFVPQKNSYWDQPTLDLFQEAVITPFSKSQIENYVEQYVLLERRPWRTKEYMEKLASIPNLMDLVTNPFLLRVSLDALPSVVEGREGFSTVRITRVTLYDHFVKNWIGANKRRLQGNDKLGQDRKVLDELINDNFERNGVNYHKELAAAIFQRQEGNPFVEYTDMRDNLSWKAKFLSSKPEPTLLREASLLSCVGNQYRFIHRSVLEYFYSRFVYEPNGDDDKNDPPPIVDHPLSQRSLIGEPSIVQFLCERVQQSFVFKERLLAIFERSKTDPEASRAAANAITILVRAGVLFNGADLKGIHIPEADLSGGQFANAVQMNGGPCKPQLGRVVVSLGSKIRAEKFFHDLAKGKRVRDLDITFNWECCGDDLLAFENALKKSRVSILRLDLQRLESSTDSGMFSTLSRIIKHPNMKTIHIVIPKHFATLSRLQLEGLPHLSKLSLEIIARSITEEDLVKLVETLKTDSTMITLDLGGNLIKEKEALALSEVLKTNQILTTLYLGSSSIGDKGALELSEALEINSTLTTLDLGGNSICDDGAVRLSEALKINSTLTTLYLGGNSIREKGALELSEALKTNKTLTTLYLGLNPVGDNGALALSEALKTNKTLTALYLGGCSIGENGALELSEALKANSTLATLYLRNNSIEKNGALALSKALKANSTLTTLYLGGNSIGETGALELSEALKSNLTLTILDLGFNSIKNNGALALSEALKTNLTLVTLYLENNPIGDNGALALSEARKTSRSMEWCLKVADQGDAYAQGGIGVLYHRGDGVPQGYSKIMKWYLKAADQGSTSAQGNIGFIYHNGQGVSRDY
ncbi:hypothetical protein BGZ58_009558 [Dissophora ornata]|nr:hypothetical protein BGZ58_009558 [Dissophora ornata]